MADFTPPPMVLIDRPYDEFQVSWPSVLGRNERITGKVAFAKVPEFIRIMDGVLDNVANLDDPACDITREDVVRADYVLCMYEALSTMFHDLAISGRRALIGENVRPVLKVVE